MSNYQTKKTINIILKGILFSGAVGSSLAMPNAVEAITKAVEPFLDDDFDKKQLKKLIVYMERQKLLELRIRGDNVHATITEKARKRLQTAGIEDITPQTPKTWDKKWRFLTYDIPADKKTQRFYLLAQLKRIGFYMLQESLWVYPYPCSEELIEIADRLEVAQHVTFIVGDLESTQEPKLIKHFQLFRHV